MNPLSRSAKNIEYSFHTDFETTPYWTCTFKWPIELSRLVIYNRDNPKYFDRVHEIQVFIRLLDGQDQLVFAQKKPEFTGRSQNNPLQVEIGNTYCIAITIKAINRSPAPLHFQQIKLFRKLPFVNQKSDQWLAPYAYTCSLSGSGFGDKLLELATSSFILESLGLRFAGLDAKSLRRACRMTNYQHSAIDIYAHLGFTELMSEPRYTEDPYILKLDNEFDACSVSEIAQHVKNSLFRIDSSRNFTSIQLILSPILCERVLINRHSELLNPSSESVEMIRLAVNTRLKENFSRTLNLVIHLRLGDVANLQIDEGQWIIPFECAWHRKLIYLTDSDRQSHERYDRIPIIEKVLEKLSASHKRSTLKITIISDGTSCTRDYVREKLSSLDPSSSTATDNAISYVQSIDDKLEYMTSLADHAIIGETSENFLDSVKSIINADVIISTNGHYCYQVSLLSTKSPFMAMAYMPRTHRDPTKHTLYWSQNDKYDTDYIVSAIESIS